ncbi:aminotransferase class I/II-fold pyridoxal phosphate-dependent enzyme [Defluviimonas sp. WL0050]|uniref:Aminotransferase class I/II-fold pyridoxal phosphate-dependent enzyme n=1 Tax=Albidovulum litorale TaxID=2984134 RepID=A0ABT2ZJ60_9RHOB|nr:aminotransferase class I/II-fold pyridoxal phosphate-dependent enzyme [Defluviimonas sp. WL0050]MCV2871168.1 aminotransferase class I/II-fold pyridoxal phosphate-dependent enzyme [Defluviimonas sp. WL0050]
MPIVSEGARRAGEAIRVVSEFAEQFLEEDGQRADFTFGNPHERPLAGLVDAIKTAAEPHTNDWFAYKTSVESATETVAAALSAELRLPFKAADVTMTQGAFKAIALAFDVLLNPGDEVIHPKPGWFAYSPILAHRGYVSVHTPLDPQTYDLDLDAIERAITPRTRIVVVNTPHNPTGRIYSRARLKELAALLDKASERIGARIFILSDEPYRRIRFDGVGFTSPAEVYPWTLIDYSYGKILLSPGQRIGYLALSPLMPEADREALRAAIFPTQTALGWGFPDATMQYAIPELEKLSLDIPALTAKRDRLVGSLRQWGYRITEPEGTFYLWGDAPGGDSLAFARRLAEKNVFVMPGTLFDCPAQFRICLTATAEMVEFALPALRDAAF